MRYAVAFLAIFVAVAMLGGATGNLKSVGAQTVDEARLDSDVDYDCGDVRIDFDYRELVRGSDKIVYVFLDANGDGDYANSPIATYQFDNDGIDDSQENFFVQTFDLPADFRIKAVMYDEGAIENNEPAPGSKAEDVEVVVVDREDTCATPVPPTATSTPVPAATSTPVPPVATPTPVVITQVIEVPVIIPQPVTQSQNVTVQAPAQPVVPVAPVVTQGSIKAPNTGSGGLLD